MDKIQVAIEAILSSKSKDTIQTQAKQIEQKLTPIQLKINLNTGVVNEQLGKISNSAKASASVFTDLFNRAQKSSHGLSAVEKEVVKLNPAIKDVTKNVGFLGQGIVDVAKKFAGWLFIGNMIMSVVRFMRTFVTTTVELDRALVGLKKVTDESAESYINFSKAAGELGVTLGKTRIEVIKSATEFARLGMSMKESLIMAEEALMLSNVGLMDISKSTSALISITKGFGVAIDDQGRNIRNIVDIVNEVGNNFAISQEGIATALERSAASLNVAGNSIEESVALITAANAVIQDEAIVGTALKTITMRLRGITDEGDELAQNLLPKLESEFRKIGLTLRENEDTFKNTYQIFDDLAGVWDELTDLQRANILELVAGKRQGRLCPLAA